MLHSSILSKWGRQTQGDFVFGGAFGVLSLDLRVKILDLAFIGWENWLFTQKLNSLG